METIYNAKAQGTSLSELSELHSLTQLDARSAVRLLQRHKAVIPVMEDKKKTKMHRYGHEAFFFSNRCMMNRHESFSFFAPFRYVYFKFKEANLNYQKVSMQPTGTEASPRTSLDKSVFIDLEPVSCNPVIYQFVSVLRNYPLVPQHFVNG